MQGEETDLRYRKHKKFNVSFGSRNVTPTRDPPPIIRTDPGKTLSPFVAYCVIVIFLIFIKFFHVFENLLPDQIQIEEADAYPNRFIGQRAELQLKRLTSLGTRVVGSYENEILALDFLKREVSFIAQEANKMYDIEVDVQKPTGSYYLMLKYPHGFRNYYANIQNFVVKLSSHDTENSILLNCHYDTVPESPGASDNGLNCAVMLEILRVLANGMQPLRNNVIFLFNGAEENPLQASHGFLSQHKWSKEVKVVINLDSAGAGGREILFQTSGEPWLAKAYAQSVPRPTAGVQAEELFHYGIIPSDTDFRIFRDFARYPGFDIAHCTNGYIYHTKFDSVDFIRPGVYQSTGDNILALVRELVNSPEVGSKPPKTRIVYFDVFTLFMIAYTEESGMILNVVAALLCPIAVIRVQKKLAGERRAILKKQYIGLLGQFLGLVLAAAAVFCTAVLLDIYKSTMSWYLRPWLVLPLYACPIVFSQALALVITNRFLKQKDLLKHRVILFINGAQHMWTVLMLIGTFVGVRTSFILMFFVLLPSFGTLFITLPGLYSANRYFIMHLLFLTFPVLFALNQAVRIFTVMIPMTARMGPQVNPEIIIGNLVLLSSATIISLIVPCVLFLRKLKTFLLSLFIIHAITVLLIIFTPLGFPYDGNVKSPALQRFYVLHCERTFHDAKGSVRRADSGIFVQSLDRNDINHVSGFLPELQRSRPSSEDCSTELFCGYPVFHSRHIKPAPFSRFIPAAPPTIHHPTSLEIVNQTQVLVNTRRIRLLVTGPDHITVGLSPRPGVKLTKWSFSHSPPEEVDIWNGRKTYMVYYSHGLMGGTLEFDLDLEISQNHADNLIDVAVVGHYLHDKKFRTTEFKKLISKFPKWAHTTPWTTTYKSWVI